MSDGTLVGYSVFDASDDCYLYNENACYIAATPDRAQQFMQSAGVNSRDGRVEAVCWRDLLRDFGCSGGEYALEAKAFAVVRTLAQEHSVSFVAEAYDGDDSLMVVQIHSSSSTADDD